MKKNDLVFLIIIMLLLGTYYLFVHLPSQKDEYKLKNSFRYGIGTIHKINSTSDGSDLVKYTFVFNNTFYYSSFGGEMFESGRIKINSRIFIIFCPENPNICHIEPNYTVPDTLKDNGLGRKSISEFRNK
jgi:hypothetical protein